MKKVIQGNMKKYNKRQGREIREREKRNIEVGNV